MSGLTRRHYAAIAAALKQAAPKYSLRTEEGIIVHENCARAIAGTLCADNPHLSMERFLRDCGVAT